ncbi:MAG: adenylate kinase [Planctomycetaceae bacterium]|nr:adenylate kinase [Planctomycetaceae bacterium]
MRIVLMGPPGSGKGTQAKRLADRYGMKHLSSGDIFRAEKSSGSELGKALAKYMDAGQLVPDDVVVEIMAKAITAVDSKRGLLLDGFPRTVAQAEALDRTLAKAGSPLDAVVEIQADDNAIVRRIVGRRSCPACNKVYHTEFMPPKDDKKCDACGAELVQRDDDTEPVVAKRLDTYHQQTEPVMGYYRSRGELPVLTVDGNKDVKDVTADLTDALESLGNV